MSSNSTQVVRDLQEKSILVSREFNAPVELVWRAFTEKEILDQWWGPAPWRAETKYQDFSVGGYWLYAMVGPENEKHWARMNYLAISKFRSFDLEDLFCDEGGNINPDLPVSTGSNVFTTTPNGTRVEYKIIFSTVEQLQQIIEMGYEEGISICLQQLHELIESGGL